MKSFRLAALAAISLGTAAPAAAQVMLGTFTFDSSEFGNTLAQSDGGAFASANWLNVVNADPGSPGYLTGANFDTGIANIGGGLNYTIGYSGGIDNAAGNDLGVVTARYSSDPFAIAFSTDGTVFGPTLVFPASAAVSTGVGTAYYYQSAGPYSATLFVTPIDLSAFGIANGSSIVAARITGTTELDLIRVAGFGVAGAIPEPATWAMMIVGFGAVGAAMRRRHKLSPATA